MWPGIKSRKPAAGWLPHWKNGKEMYGRVRDKALDGVKATDQAVRDNPYQAMGIALGVGAIIGYLAARACSRND